MKTKKNKMRFLPLLWLNFLGNSPNYYKIMLISFLIANPLIFYFISPFIAGWLVLMEFIFTLSMSSKCYPLPPAGLIAIQAVLIGMTTPELVGSELIHNFDVIMLICFMVAAIHFMRDVLLLMFTRLFLSIQSKTLLSFSFCFLAAILSAFLDALTVISIIIGVCLNFNHIYQKFVLKTISMEAASVVKPEPGQNVALGFQKFLQSLIMHSAVGTVLGGSLTLVGEPQNLIIGAKAGWNFTEFFLRVAPVSIPAVFSGLIVCVVMEKSKLFGYGTKLPEGIRSVLLGYKKEEKKERTDIQRAKLFMQALVGVWLIVCLSLHLATVGLIGLSVMIFASSLNGVITEKEFGESFKEGLPFAAVLMTFFTIVTVITKLQLMAPIMAFITTTDGMHQSMLFYVMSAVLSVISDNVFVGTLYIEEAFKLLQANIITREQFDIIAVAINTGTNLPAVATPNGHAALLFLLTSSLAPILRLSYFRMLFMALPYTIILATVGFLSLMYIYPGMIIWYTKMGLLLS